VLVELNARSLPIAVLDVPRPDAPTPGERPGLGAGPRREVESVGEIWRVDDEWWRQPINRRYIEIVMKGGKHLVLYQDLNSEEWFEQSL
jgi:hypothetical protein